ncbi:MAG: N-formylglutamate amidohydrolase [Flavobacteriales bacterium]|nr:N-formylglutamate amidohydrolase [Flavobacteriales bacterium]MCB9167935.1 N-formylglutamate amidohydrolase [Flavobacteriales bacterium]
MTLLLLTCEHGGHDVPSAYRHLFLGRKELLRSHRGWDPGALGLYRALRHHAAGAFHSTTTRLLVELNRSPHHPRLFSDMTRSLPPSIRASILRDHYDPYRRQVAEFIDGHIRHGERVLHISVHSFTPVLHGVARVMDIGLLYDPSRRTEARFGQHWAEAIRDQCPGLRVRMNAPYRGISDGLTTALRRKYRHRYVGMELEVNQEHTVQGGARMSAAITECLDRSLQEVLASF